MRNIKALSNATGGEDAAIVFATQIWLLFVSLGIQSMLAWMLGPDGRGAYAVCLLFGMLFGAVFTFGTERGAQYFVMSNQLSLSRAVSVAVIIALLGSAAAMIVGGFLIHTPFTFFQKADLSSFRVSLLLIPLSSLVTILQLQLAGLRKFVQLGVITLVQTSVNLALMVVLVWMLQLGVNGALTALIASSLIGVCLLFLELRAHDGLTLTLPRWGHFQPILSYGARCYLARIGHLVDMRLGIVLLAVFATREEIGLFTAASALSLKVLIFSQSIETTIAPRIAADPEGRPNLVGQSIRISGLFTGVAVAGVVIASFPLVLIILSPKFLPSVPIIWILAPGIFMQGGAKILMAYFRATNRPGITSCAIWVGLITNSLVVVVLYPAIGLPAAAWAMSIGFASRTLVLFIAYRRISGRGVADTLRPRRNDLTMIKSLVIGIYGRVFAHRRKHIDE